MNNLRTLAFAVVVTAFFAVSANIQTVQAQAANKIAVLHSEEFANESNGITRLINANKTLRAEFTPLETELQNKRARLEQLKREIGPGMPNAQAKADEAEKLNRDINFKAEDAQARYNRRQNTLIGPIYQDIQSALGPFAVQNGYALIFDASKNDIGFLVYVAPPNNVTRQFIDFYNKQNHAAAK